MLINYSLVGQSQIQRTNRRKSHNRPPRLDNRGIVKRLSRIPSQMPQSIPAMKCKRQRCRKLNAKLGRHRQRTKRRSQARRVQMHACERRSQVCEAEEVEGNGDGETGDSVEGREDPGYLWLVDAEVGGCWALFALLDEDIVAVCWGHLLGCDGAVRGGC